MSTLLQKSLEKTSSYKTSVNQGYYGEFGGIFVPPMLEKPLQELAEAFDKYKNDPEFIAELEHYNTHYLGRPTPVFYCERLTQHLGGAKIFLKREDLNHLGAHKGNNCVGQILLAKRMGKTRIIAETGAGQHGVASAAVSALFGLECIVYMGEEDMKRQELNVFRMRMMGAKVVAAMSGQRTLKEAVDEALGAYAADPDAFYLLGSAVGPNPYPEMVRFFQSVIGREARAQMLDLENNLPDKVIACVGGGSNAIGIFADFIPDENVELIGVEPGGIGNEVGQHAATLTYGKPGTLHGFRSYLLSDEAGEASEVYSISAGLDYPGVGPEHAYLKDCGRAKYTVANDKEAIEALYTLSRMEGIIPALESSHALAHAIKIAPSLPKETRILVSLSGRGDKDMAQLAEMNS